MARPDPNAAMKSKTSLRWMWHLPLLVFAVTMAMPLGLMVTTALGDAQMALRPGVSLWHVFIPNEWNWDNFAYVWKKVNFLRYYLNSLVVALFVTVGQVFTSACAAYAFARLRWPGRDRVFFAYLATMMVPNAVTLIPNFALMKEIPGWLTHLLPFVDWLDFRYLGTSAGAAPVGRLVGLDSYFALIVPNLFNAYGVFLLRQFLLGIPRELDEAARIDGATHWQIFSRVILPLSKPGLVTLAIFAFMGTWSNLLWPVIVTNLEALRTLPLGLMIFQQQSGAQWHYVMAGALLMLLPVIVIFIAGQRYFVSGIATGAVKG
ncbi:MAG: hypothetical protein JWM32_2790 [Verrucomicrobia bacterium]|nr:hypothetical protein [Verrucomicrobiota bacterium]